MLNIFYNLSEKKNTFFSLHILWEIPQIPPLRKEFGISPDLEAVQAVALVLLRWQETRYIIVYGKNVELTNWNINWT